MDPLVHEEMIEPQQSKVFYFLSHPIQYFSPLLQQLAKVIHLEVFYFCDSSVKGGFDKGFGKAVTWDIPLLNGYKFKFLKNTRPNKGLNNRFLDVWNPAVFKTIMSGKVDVIIVNGWTYSSTWLAILTAKLKRKKVWLRAESPLNQELLKSKKALLLKKLFFKYFFFKLIDKFLYIGSENKSFFKYYGVPEKKLLFTPYSVDNDYFRNHWNEVKDKLPAIRDRLNLPADKKIILYSGKYISKKRPLDLLEAFSQLNSEKYFLVFAGEGELRPAMEKFIADKQLKSVLLTGFINQSQLPLYYAVADVFVMCSGPGETWGLSVNEAMNFAKPVIVSNTCGSSADLVKPGENGYVFEEGNVNQLTGYLEKVLSDDAFRKQAGQRSLEIVDTFSINNIVFNIQNTLNKKQVK